MKSLKSKVIIIISSIFLAGCIEPIELKILKWNDNAIRLLVVDGGATTSFLWKIHFQKNGSKRERLIFQSYASPYIEDITIAGDNLLIHCGVKRGNEQRIEINMKNVEDFIDDPIIYRRSVLDQTNDCYHEPEFIRQDRADDIKYGLSR